MPKSKMIAQPLRPANRREDTRMLLRLVREAFGRQWAPLSGLYILLTMPRLLRAAEEGRRTRSESVELSPFTYTMH